MPLRVVLTVGFDQSLLRPRTLVLQCAGYHVESASSLKDAVDRFQSGDFDLVLLCHSVPRKDRYRLTSFLRSSGSRTPIVSFAGTLGECDAFGSATLEVRAVPGRSPTVSSRAALLKSILSCC
jgi:CheY-like chemotaxis protein